MRYCTFDEYTALGFAEPFSNETVNSFGMSEKPGILYDPGPLVYNIPFGLYTSSSIVNIP